MRQRVESLRRQVELAEPVSDIESNECGSMRNRVNKHHGAHPGPGKNKRLGRDTFGFASLHQERTSPEKSLPANGANHRE
jgi:hypothetical protein